jgi:hypothetical protein
MHDQVKGKFFLHKADTYGHWSGDLGPGEKN